MAVMLMTPSPFMSVASIIENARARCFLSDAICYLRSTNYCSSRVGLGLATTRIPVEKVSE